MKKFAVESEAAAVEQEKRSAAGMLPAQCMALLNKERYRLKLDADDKIQIAPADRVDRRTGRSFGLIRLGFWNCSRRSRTSRPWMRLDGRTTKRIARRAPLDNLGLQTGRRHSDGPGNRRRLQRRRA
jgi:hypothetical protein